VSYSFQVRFDADGTGTVSGVTGDVPTTGYVGVNGHTDPSFTNIGASLYDEAGGMLVGGFGTARVLHEPPAVAAPAVAEEDRPGELAATADDGGQAAELAGQAEPAETAGGM
jgi:hypothetical protein